MSALERYRPGRDGPFGRDEAAHLLRRVGFGATLGEVDRAVEEGPEAVVDRLLSDEEGAEAASTERAAEALWELNQLDPMQGLWLHRMRHSAAAGREKLALFLHDHFATSYVKVQSAELMWRQYRLLRERGTGPFGALLLEVARDPAMLIWLDSNSNRRRHPNENFAREVMELFSLGVGHYSERDIQEAARAFTGWHVRHGRFWFNERAHDPGEKELFGQRGNLDGGDVVRLCVEQPAAALFLAGKLLRFYVHPEPPAEWVAELARALRTAQLRLGEVLHRLFLSRAFFSSAARRRTIKSPVEFCVGSLRALQAQANLKRVARASEAMGQALFAPPSVKGWDGDRSWISSQTLLIRGRFAAAFGSGSEGEVNAPWGLLCADSDSPAALVRALVAKLHQGSVSAASVRVLEEYATSRWPAGPEAAARGLVYLILTLPEYQLN